MNRIALVEDHERLSTLVRKALAAAGIEVDVFDRIASAGHAIAETAYGAIVVDRGLPDGDGLSLVRKLRADGNVTPCLMLTARDAVHDRVEGLEAGADDYLAKPFDLNILLVRLKSLLRRTAWQSTATPETPPPALADQTDEYAFNHRTIRFDTLELIAPNRTTHLTLMEADLLRYLTQREGHIVSRKDILEDVWRVHEDTDTRAIDNFIVRLRRYIEDDPADPQHLVTVRGIGYRFLANP